MFSFLGMKCILVIVTNQNILFHGLILWETSQIPNYKLHLFLYRYLIFFSCFFFLLFYFTILYWFCHTLTWIHHGRTWVPNPEPPSHLHPHIISLGHPSAPAPSILYPVSNLDWRFISYMIVYVWCLFFYVILFPSHLYS